MAIPKVNVMLSNHDNGDDYGNKNEESRRGLKRDNEGNKDAFKSLAIIRSY